MVQARKTQPIIEIDDLQPDWSIKSFKAFWQERGLIAYAYLEPIDDQPARGYVLETTYRTVSGKEPGPRQREQGAVLASKVREMMKSEMIDAGWQPYPVPGISHGVWQHSSRVTASSASAQGDQAAQTSSAPESQLEQDQPAAQPAREYKVYGSKEAREAARESGAAPAYTRVVSLKTITFRCARCGSTVAGDHLPGAKPERCKPCAKIVRP